MEEIKKKKKPIMKIAIIIGVLIIPLMYSFFYLDAFKDPYSDLESVPVAIVNLDEGAQIDGENRNVGNEICDTLKENGTFNFCFVDEETGKTGVEGDDYYAEIVIPKDFSTSVASATSTDKTVGKITFTANQKRNYLGYQIIRQALPLIESSVTGNIDKEIVGTLSGKLNEVPDSLATLDDGLTQLFDGSKTLNNGLGTLSEGTITLKEGTNKLSMAVPTLKSGVTLLSNGAETVADGAGKINDNAKLIKTNVALLNDASGQLSSASNDISSGASSLSDGLDELYSNLGADGKLGAGTKQLADGTEKLYEALGSTGQLGAGTQQLADGTSSLYSAMSADGALGKGTSDLQSGTETYANSIYSSIKSALANSGSDQLAYISTVLTESQIVALYDTESPYAFNNTAYLTHLQAGDNAFAKALYGLSHYTVSATGKTYDLTNSADYTELVTFFATYDNANLATDVASIQKAVDSYSTLKSTGQLFVGAKAINTGATTLNSSIKALVNKNATDGSNGVYLLYAGAQSLNKAIIAEVSEDGDITLLKNGAAMLNGAIVSQVNPNAKDGSNGVYLLKIGSNTLKGGSAEFSDKMALFDSKVGTLSGALTQFSNGTTDLADGALTLSNGLGSLTSKTSVLINGISQLNDGANSLSSGASKLQSGSTTLKNGLGTAKDGVEDTITDANEELKQLDGLDTYAENPVDTEEANINEVANYGTAFAPYFMSLSLWVGGLMIFFGIYLDMDKKLKKLSRDSNHSVLQFIVFSALGIAQALLLVCVVKYALGIAINSMPLFILSCCVISLSFLMVIMFCLTHLGPLGKLVSLLLLILQLTSCAGTFPIETCPKFFQILYDYLPMTYSVGVLKEAVSGSWNANANKNLAVLFAFGIVFFAITAVLTGFKKAKQKRLAAENKETVNA